MIDGKIYTMNGAQPLAEAVAIKGDRIIKVGSTEEISYLISKETRIIYLEGRAVTPGFIDTHIHLADFGRFLMWMNLASANSISKMQVLLSERVSNEEENRWIVGRGWDEKRFIEKRLPHKGDLDSVSPNNPVILYHQSGQIALVNSKALELAGITEHTKIPAGGLIDLNEKSGEPTGILRESATDLVWNLVPEVDIDELVKYAAMACEKIVQAGITSIHWLAESAVDIVILKRLLKSKKNNLRIILIIPSSLLSNLSLSEDLKNVSAKIGGIEVYIDGYLASRTAALSKPYEEENQNRGKLLISQKDLKGLSSDITEKGYQLVFHAMGDKAVDFASKAIDELNLKKRPRIDPAALLNPELIQRLKRQKAVVSVQPLVAISEFAVYDAIDHLGEERARWLYPLKTLVKEGVCVCGGSDCPMEPLNPFLGIFAAVNRRFYPEEQLTIDEALQIYTKNGAFASFEENEKGSIEEGKVADICVLSKDPYEMSMSELTEVVVEMTMINGKTVFSRSE